MTYKDIGIRKSKFVATTQFLKKLDKPYFEKLDKRATILENFFVLNTLYCRRNQ